MQVSGWAEAIFVHSSGARALFILVLLFKYLQKTVKKKLLFILHAHFFCISLFKKNFSLTHKPQKTLLCFQLASNKQHNNLIGLQNALQFLN